MTTKSRTAVRKAPEGSKAVRPAERVSRYDVYEKELRQRHNEAEGNVKRLDLDIAEATAALDAMMNERADWANIQNHAAHMLNAGKTIEGNSRHSPQLEDRTDE